MALHKNVRLRQRIGDSSRLRPLVKFDSVGAPARTPKTRGEILNTFRLLRRQRPIEYKRSLGRLARSFRKRADGRLDGPRDELSLFADKRKPRRSNIFRRAIDKMLGQFDVLHELDMRIEMEGRRQDPVELPRLVIFVLGA